MGKWIFYYGLASRVVLVHLQPYRSTASYDIILQGYFWGITKMFTGPI
jgi:hypothetical protein